ncbi:MAG: S8 family serine peptidase [Gemmatimonadaceae bacterium]|nr:S8 family serine peptidase [Gemmatimonadaceae bacterium]
MRFRLVAVCALVSLAACGGGDGPTGPAAVASIAVSSPPQAIAAIGESVQLTATAKDAKGGSIASVTFTWTSSDPNVATVAAGVVTAVGNGTATITAASGSISGAVQVTVQQSVTQVVVTWSTDTLRAIGDTARAMATARDARGNAVSGKTLTWSSASPGVVTIDDNGLMTAVAEGTAIVRGSSDAVQGERTMQVRQRAARLAITRQPFGARAGIALTTQPQAEVQDARGTRVVSDNSTIVTASVATGGGTIVAGATATSVAGVVTFSNLAVGGAIGLKALQFGAPSVSGATSDAFALSAGVAAALVVVAGNNQTALAGTTLSALLQAGVRDGYTNPVIGTPITYVVQQGGGTLSSVASASDQNGNATASYTLPLHAGTSVVVATSSAIPSAQAQFSITATPNGVISGVVSSSVSGIRAFNLRSTAAARERSSAPPVIPKNSVAQDVASIDDAIPGELLVTYRPDRIDAPAIGSHAFQQRSVAAEVSVSIRDAIAPAVRDGLISVAGVSPAILTALVRVKPGISEAAAFARLRADPRVLAVERNGRVYSHVVAPTAMEALLLHSGHDATVKSNVLERLMPYPFDAARLATFPGDGTYPGNALYMSQAWHYNMIALPQAWGLTQGSASVLVAVVDDGIRFDHPAMAGVTTTDGYDFVPVGTVALCVGGTASTNGDDDGPDPDPTQPSNRSFNNAGTCVNEVKSSGNHGLHVSGTIGAVRTNASGVVGVNWQVRIRPVRVLGVHGSGSNFTVAQGILYAAGLPADDGAGGTVTPTGGPARIINMSLGGTTFSTAMSTAVAQALANGTLIIASAGNNNNSTPSYPASYPDVVSVSAVGPTLNRATYSSYGATVTIAAPGGQVSSGYSHGVLSSTWNFVTNAPTVDSWQGTSMAAPHVTGVAALLAAREPSLTVTQLRQRLLDYAVDIGAAGRDDFFGVGLLNARNVLTSSLGPPRSLFVRLMNATTGAIVRTLTAGAGGAYEFGGLPDGSYWVFAGHDESGDGLTGLPWRAWGALGTAASPTSVVVDGAGVHTATFSVSTGFELEPNGTAEQANELVVDGYMNGDLTALNDADYYRLRIAQPGTYTVQVTGQVGACRYALEADPVVTITTALGAAVASSDDIDPAGNDYCARVSRTFTPGDYLVRIGASQTGRYVVSVRKS